VNDLALRHLLRSMQWRESIASVSLSHDQGCDCEVCKAASGDEEAFARVVARLDTERDGQ
jgi:hypothetical protein